MDAVDDLRSAASRGALVAFAVVVPVTLITAVLTDGSSVTGWRVPLYFLLLAGYGVGGVVAGRAAPGLRLTAGALAGLGGFALWLVLRIGIWAVRSDGRGLVRGDEPVAGPGQVLTAAVLATALGMAGAILGASRARPGPSGP